MNTTLFQSIYSVDFVFSFSVSLYCLLACFFSLVLYFVRLSIPFFRTHCPPHPFSLSLFSFRSHLLAGLPGLLNRVQVTPINHCANAKVICWISVLWKWQRIPLTWDLLTSHFWTDWEQKKHKNYSKLESTAWIDKYIYVWKTHSQLSSRHWCESSVIFFFGK